MTLRTKKSGTNAGNDRQAQKIVMPYNSIFVLGPNSNRQWLHGIRADKRPKQEKSAEEVAFEGGRISITFRQIGTFHNSNQETIWGSGAKSKDKSTAHLVSTREEEVENMLEAFGKENHDTNFDWDASYGIGFDVVDLAPRKFELTPSIDAVANLRVRMALALKSVQVDLVDLDFSRSESQFVHHPWTHGLSNLEKPVLKGRGKEVEGDVAILLHLEKENPSARSEGIEGFDTAELFRCAAQSNELLYIWRQFLANPSSSPTHRYRLEATPSTDTGLRGEIRATLNSWEEYLIDEDKLYVGGEFWTVLDCAFWPVLNCLVAECGAYDPKSYPALTAYHERGHKRMQAVAIDTS